VLKEYGRVWKISEHFISFSPKYLKSLSNELTVILVRLLLLLYTKTIGTLLNLSSTP